MKEKKRNKEVKEKKKKSKKTIIIPIILLLFIGVFLFIKFGLDKKYTITLNTDGGSAINSIEVKDNEIIKLPEEPTKEDYIFSAWVNEENNIVIPGTKINKNTTLKAIWIKEELETITLSFNVDEKEPTNAIIQKGTIILLPVVPVKKGYIFAGWVDENDNIITEGMNITRNLVLKATWIKEDTEFKTIVFDVNGGSSIGKIIVEKGKAIRFPTNPIKAGFVFKGWIDEKGNTITKDTIITDDITIKVLWVEPYTCPSDCTPSINGSTCTKVSTKQLTIGTGCPSGYTLKEGQCLNLSTQYDKEASPEYGGGGGMCLSDEGTYTLIFGQGATIMCAKKTNKITTSTCSSGYKKEGNICKKTETIKCTAN